MGKEIITVGNIEVENQIFTDIKLLLLLEEVDIDNVLVSNKISFGERNYKYFIGCLSDDYKIKPLHMMQPKISA